MDDDLKKTISVLSNSWFHMSIIWHDKAYWQFSKQYMNPITKAAHQALVSTENFLEIIKQAESHIN